MHPSPPRFAVSSAKIGNHWRVFVRVLAAFLVAVWFSAAHAAGSVAGFGVSVTVVHRILAQTPTGTVSTLCDRSICPTPSVSLDPVDTRTGTRIIHITY